MNKLLKSCGFVVCCIYELINAVPLTKAEQQMVPILRTQVQSAINFLQREKGFKSDAYRNSTWNALTYLDRLGEKDPESGLKAVAEELKKKITVLAAEEMKAKEAAAREEQERKPTGPQVPVGPQKPVGGAKGYKEQFNDLMQKLSGRDKKLQKNELIDLFEDPSIALLTKMLDGAPQSQWANLAITIKADYERALKAHAGLIQNPLKKQWGATPDISQEVERFGKRVDAVVRNRVYQQQVKEGGAQERVYSLNDFKNYVDRGLIVKFSGDREKTEREALDLASKIIAVAVHVSPAHLKETVNQIKSKYYELVKEQEEQLVSLESALTEGQIAPFELAVSKINQRSEQFDKKLDAIVRNAQQKTKEKPVEKGKEKEEYAEEDEDERRENFEASIKNMTGKSSSDKDTYERKVLETAQAFLELVKPEDRADTIKVIKEKYEAAVRSQYSWPNSFGNPTKIADRKKSFEDQLNEWLVEMGYPEGVATEEGEETEKN